MRAVVQPSVAKPWYKQPWPWFLIAFPVTAILAGVVTLVLAIRSNDGLVADDYYKQGLGINRDLARVETARRLGLSAGVSLRDGHVQVVLVGKPGWVPPDTLRARWSHPTQSGSDRAAQLVMGENGFAAALPDLSPGHWNLVLEDPATTWRLAGQVSLPFEGEAHLQP